MPHPKGCPRAGMQAAAGEGGLLIWGNYYREDTVESCQLPTFPTAGGRNVSVLKWGVELDGARRFHYRVEARRSRYHFYA